tara:strand:+ start:9 stop:917 length:909 start_codon:yes stop_codon:yes gene_type:complete
MIEEFYSNGKLLITSEYGVLDGALSLALPTKFGQSLTVEENNLQHLNWKSLDEKKAIWFEGDFDLKIAKQISSTDIKTAEQLLKILIEARKLNTNFLSGYSNYNIKTKLDFPRNWGLGTSSTLINNIAQWANIDPYTLLWNSFSGSGYDIACAKYNTPILYQLKNKKPVVTEVDFNPPYKHAIYFIYLNKKQNSREGIATYRKSDFDKEKFIAETTSLTKKIITCTDLETFKNLITNHENVISKVLKQAPIKESHFLDYDGAIKSLGAWGGDFIMAVGSKETFNYFKTKGYSTILTYNELIL